MRRLVGVALVCLMLGAFLGYGFRADAAPKTVGDCTSKASQAAVIHFITVMARGGIALVPAGCTDSLVIQSYGELYRENETLQTLNTRLATLQGLVNKICPVVAKIQFSYVVC